MPLLWLLVPGYALAIPLMWFSDRGFVSIAVDAGGVATGPLANSLLLSLALGTASAMGRDPLLHGPGSSPSSRRHVAAPPTTSRA